MCWWVLRFSWTNFDNRLTIVTHGDSITPLSEYPLKLRNTIKSAQPLLTVNSYDEAIPSAGFSVVGIYPDRGTLTQDAFTSVDPWLKSKTPLNRTVLFLFAGTNDIFLATKTGLETFALFETYLLDRFSAGWAPQDIYVVTMLPRNSGFGPGVDAAFEVIRQNYISLVVASQPTYGFTLVRADLNTDIGDFGDQNNLTYYLDGIHLNNQAGGNTLTNVCYAAF